MSKSNISRKGLVDGLPNSYDTNYILKTHKRCFICTALIQEADITENELICDEKFVFYHKSCLNNKGILYKHYNQKDKSTPIILEEKKDEN